MRWSARRLHRGDLARAAVLIGVVLAGAGCQQVLASVFDIRPTRGRRAPPPPPDLTQPDGMVALQVPLDTARPPIERHLNPDSARAQLPRDHAGNIDWVQALRQGVIRPRLSISPVPAAELLNVFRFGFDFMFPGPDTTFDASFPHSVHTEWVACAQCHPRIFPYRGTKVTMGDVFQGKYCGECHGKVAFPVATGCERCHTRLSMPADRAEPELIGTIVMTRPTDSTGTSKVSLADLPPAVFPHWVHRMRYRCSVCHLALFEPRAGTNRVTMREIGERQRCGACHNGTVAFAATIGTCQRCHRPDDQATEDQP